MPIKIYSENLKFKDTNGNYHGIIGISDNTADQQIRKIEAKASAAASTIPAAATALNQEIQKLKRITKNYYNLIEGQLNKRSSSSSEPSISFTWNSDYTECTVNGNTNDKAGYNFILGSKTSIPTGFQPGKSYRVTSTSTNAFLKLEAVFYTNSEQTSTGYRHFPNTGNNNILTLPENLTGLAIELCAIRGHGFENAKISNLSICPLDLSQDSYTMIGYPRPVVDQESAEQYFGENLDANEAPINTFNVIKRLNLSIKNLPNNERYEPGTLFTWLYDSTTGRSDSKIQMYVTTNGIQTRCQQPTGWSQWTTNITDLNNKINNLQNNFYLTSKNTSSLYPQWVQGTIEFQSGTESFSSTQIKSNFLPILPNSLLHVEGLTKLCEIMPYLSLACIIYDNQKNILGTKYFMYKDSSAPYTPHFYQYIVIPYKNASYVKYLFSGINTTLSDFNTHINILNITNEEYIKNLEYKEMHHGVGELKLDFYDGRYSYAEGFTTSSNFKISSIYPIPKDGFCLYHTDYMKEMLYFLKLQNGELTLATDYKYYHPEWDVQENYAPPTGYSDWSGYYPYAENTFFFIMTATSSNLDNLHISTGHITDNNGRLPNLTAGASLLGVRVNNSQEKANQYLDINTSWNLFRENESKPYYTLLSTYFTAYFSILPLRAVQSITVAPPFEIVARIYKIDNDNKIADITEEIFGHVIFNDAYSKVNASDPTIYRPHRNVSGVYHIDFSAYDYDGIILVGIPAPFSKETSGVPIQSTMGMLNKYDDVYNSIFVEWKSGVNVTYDSGIPSICKRNIDTIKHTISFIDMKGHLSDGGYGNWDTTSKIPWGVNIGNCSGWWYSGSNLNNGPHMHVTPKSYITASKNRHSRVYVPTHPGMRDEGNQTWINMNNLYGTVSSSASMLIHGLPCGIETFSLCSELAENFEYRELHKIEDLRPGDLLACGTFTNTPAEGEDATGGSHGHVITITEKVSINGEVWCVNTFEGAQPYTQFRTLINYSAFNGYLGNKIHRENTNDIDIFKFMSYDAYVARYQYHKIARVPDNMLRTIRDAYGPYDEQDYSVTSIMCDAGSDAVYCIGEYMTLTVTDGTTSFDLYRNGMPVSPDPVDLTQYNNETFNDGIVYTVTGMFNTSGYYEIKVNNKTKETFFVPPDRFVQYVNDVNNNKITIYFDPSEINDKVEAIRGEYQQESQQTDSLERSVYHWQDIDETQIVQSGEFAGKCAYTMDYAPTFCDGILRTPISVKVLRRTPYGTYTVARFKQGNLLRQRARLLSDRNNG